MNNNGNAWLGGSYLSFLAAHFTLNDFCTLLGGIAAAVSIYQSLKKAKNNG